MAAMKTMAATSTCDDERIMFVLLLGCIGRDEGARVGTPAGTRGTDDRAQLNPRSAPYAAKLSVGSGRALPRTRGARSIHLLYFRDSRKAGVCKPRTAAVASAGGADGKTPRTATVQGVRAGRRAAVLGVSLRRTLAVVFLQVTLAQADAL